MYLGDQCSVLCFNGGTCNKDNCTCRNGFTGKFCESRKLIIDVDVHSSVADDKLGKCSCEALSSCMVNDNFKRQRYCV